MRLVKTQFKEQDVRVALTMLGGGGAMFLGGGLLLETWMTCVGCYEIKHPVDKKYIEETSINGILENGLIYLH